MEDLVIYENLINEKALVIFEEVSINVLSEFLVIILLLLFVNAAISLIKNI